MRFGAEVRIDKNWDEDRVARSKALALHRLANEAKRPVSEIAPLILESRREDPSGDWWYQIRVNIQPEANLIIPEHMQQG